MKVPSIFKNELVHYGLIFLAVLNIVGYVSARAYECLLLFGVGYYAANTYLNNVPLSIIAGLFLSNFVFGCGRVSNSVSEGMKGVREHLTDAMKSVGKAGLEGGAEAKEKISKCEEDEEEIDGQCVKKAENFQNRIIEAMGAIKEANDADVEAKAAMANEMQKKEKEKKD